MPDPQVKVYITAQDAFSSQLNAFKRKLGDVAGGMTFTTSATGRWEEGLRRLASSQSESTNQMVKGITQGNTWTSGLSKAGNAVTNLAGNLVGANNQVANMAEGLLSAFGGGGVVTVAAIGIAALSSAFLYFTKQAREASKAYDEYMNSLRKQTPLGIVGAKLDLETEQLANLKRQAASIPEYDYGAGNQGENPLAADVKKQQAAVDELQKQYNQLKASLYDVSGATAAALQLFDANVVATQKAVAEIFENTGKNWNKIPGVIRDMNTEISTFRSLIASTLDPLEKLRLEDRLKEAVKLRDALAALKAGSPFGASVGGDPTRRGASAEEEQRSVAAAIAAELSEAMSGVGGERGESEFGSATRKRLEEALVPLVEIVQQFGLDMANAIGDAFTIAFTTGDAGKAIQKFGKAMLAGLGSVFTSLGKQYLKFGTILAPLVKLLYNPITSAWASTAIGIALIALGKSLGSLATSDGGRGGGGGGGYESASSAQSGIDRERRENGTLTVIWDGDFADPDDPRFQDKMSKTMELAAERGVTRVRFIPRRG